MAPADPTTLLLEHFGPGAPASVLSVPGRVNLIGEHIDYHNLPVMPMAIQRRVRLSFRPRDDRRVRAVSTGNFTEREFAWTDQLEPAPAGDWENYIRAAAQALNGRWELPRGIDAALVSDLPPAAGLSSSSAVLVAFTLALLRANGVHASFEELMEILPEGEYFVGTRGGGMDHAAVLASRAGCALLLRFAPVSATPVPIPPDWSFLVAHSLTTAEKSGALREEYNVRRTAGNAALQRLGLSSYRAAIGDYSFADLEALGRSRLAGQEQKSFLHVVTEARRVNDAVEAIREADSAAFGRLINASHDSLRDQLRVSSPALDALVEAAREGGALGARLTGAGFGGCAIVLTNAADRPRVREEIFRRYYSDKAAFDPAQHLIDAEPSGGALSD